MKYAPLPKLEYNSADSASRITWMAALLSFVEDSQFKLMFEWVANGHPFFTGPAARFAAFNSKGHP